MFAVTPEPFLTVAVPLATSNHVLKRPTVANQKSVALESGVSRSTVGAILSGGALALRYSEETRSKVLAAAAKLNYRPS